ncbi:DNA translocase FtsK [Iodobacter sp.]|uniref:DNA translocase FtsK n=1 Tax=Iodobacter sp. TaxID=1915058 RepID=UPI0025EEF5A3|nr:DNA translocase FtsK [Iodobacter sp.]
MSIRFISRINQLLHTARLIWLCPAFILIVLLGFNRHIGLAAWLCAFFALERTWQPQKLSSIEYLGFAITLCTLAAGQSLLNYSAILSALLFSLGLGVGVPLWRQKPWSDILEHTGLAIEQGWHAIATGIKAQFEPLPEQEESEEANHANEWDAFDDEEELGEKTLPASHRETSTPPAVKEAIVRPATAPAPQSLAVGPTITVSLSSQPPIKSTELFQHFRAPAQAIAPVTQAAALEPHFTPTASPFTAPSLAAMPKAASLPLIDLSQIRQHLQNDHRVKSHNDRPRQVEPSALPLIEATEIRQRLSAIHGKPAEPAPLPSRSPKAAAPLSSSPRLFQLEPKTPPPASPNPPIRIEPTLDEALLSPIGLDSPIATEAVLSDSTVATVADWEPSETITLQPIVETATAPIPDPESRALAAFLTQAMTAPFAVTSTPVTTTEQTPVAEISAPTVKLAEAMLAIPPETQLTAPKLAISPEYEFVTHKLMTAAEPETTAHNVALTPKLELPAAVLALTPESEFSAPSLRIAAESELTTSKFVTTPEHGLTASQLVTATESALTAPQFTTATEHELAVPKFATAPEHDLTATKFATATEHELTWSKPPAPQPLPLAEPMHYSDDFMPSLSLLHPPDPEIETISQDDLLDRGILIEEKLAEFRVKASVLDAYAGPVITRYEIEPAIGVRGAQIVNLMKDLARALGLVSIRVVETIPGKTCMGLELPNPTRQMIRLSEILSSDVYQQNQSKLTIALGKDITGAPIVTDLAKAPHMLVAGTTGSGKSVGVNAMILSLLYKATPEEVRFIMVDPKMLELSVYDGIPHLLAPVVTDMKLAANALNWCVAEMEKRYRLMSTFGVRNLAGFNQKLKEAEQRGERLTNPFSLTPDEPEALEHLPFIVVVVDEFADLMMVAGKKIEELIARLAQKARAAGIHLILATQRPSVDVITGLIKANIPTRLAFQVSSKIDSRTILDQMGAEALLGQGDMLFLPPGTGYPQRIHGAFVDDNEVHRVVEHLKQFGEPRYIDGILNGGFDAEASASNINNNNEGGEADPIYDEAVALVLKSRRASISAVQRQLRIGYNRAARLIDQMENAGIVSQMESNGNRTVLAPPSAEI